jgi:CelD/BcsL family acetyltransferase involved in cellulose biosynthesis
MARILVSRPDDLADPAGQARLGARWRALEAGADGSFFQSWSWVGCCVAARFPDPVLVEALEGGETVGLALFNRRRGLFGDTLLLGETGDGSHDSPFVEHNGPLLRRGREELAGPMLAAALRGFGRRMVLSGIGDGLAATARTLPGCAVTRGVRAAPWVDFAALDGRGYEAGLSANTRQQLRRSARRYGADGTLRGHRADGVAEGLAFLDSLAALHQARWTARGKPGAFADPFFRNVHHALVTSALPRGEVELWHVAAGPVTLGYLYNFKWKQMVSAYQSGFAFPAGDNHRKPGLTSHAIAIVAALAEGLAGYDFLGGGDRYKTSLANSCRDLHWLELGPCWRPAALRTRLPGHLVTER